MLVSNKITYQIEQKVLLQPTSASFLPGQIYGIIGHNGSGKSTYLKLLAKQLAGSTGQVLVNGRSLSALSARQLARQISYLPQYLPSDVNLTVAELVQLGRFAWQSWLGHPSQQDSDRVNWALKQTQTLSFSARKLDALSGGERQRVWLAMCLAQQSQYLLLDEPLSALDINHQIDVMQLLHALAKTQQIGIIVVIHDINLASEFCDTILAFKGGQLQYNLPAQQLLDSTILHDIYAVDFTIVPHPNRPYQVALV